ncbi:MAG: hypothetical protein U0271_25895 [Polyangiaceae bacterium]
MLKAPRPSPHLAPIASLTFAVLSGCSGRIEPDPNPGPPTAIARGADGASGVKVPSVTDPTPAHAARPNEPGANPALTLDPLTPGTPGSSGALSGAASNTPPAWEE